MITKEWQEHHGQRLESKDRFDVIDCEHCGFAHVIPLQDPKTDACFYKEEFYQSKEDYIKNHSKDLEWWSIEYNEKYEFFETHLANQSPKSILDIGSGPGFFLKVGRDRGWETIGIEPGRPAYQFSSQELGLTIHNEAFSSENYMNFGKFDVVHMNNVLEHINAPHRFLQLVYNIIKPQGLICVTVPNDFSPLQEMVVELLHKDRWWVVPKEHINYFNRDSLTALMESIGFESLLKTASFPLEIFILMGDDYIGKKELGRQIHARRKKFDLNFAKLGETDIKREMYNAFAQIGVGRQITIFGRKP